MAIPIRVSVTVNLNLRGVVVMGYSTVNITVPPVPSIHCVVDQVDQDRASLNGFPVRVR